MSEEFKARLKRVYEVEYGKGDWDASAEIMSPDATIHRPPLPDVVGIQALKEWAEGVNKAYTDPRFTVHEIILEGNTGAFRATWQGKHTGPSPLVDVPPTGKQVSAELACVFHLENGKMVEAWWLYDWLGLFMQIGVVPPLGGGRG
jgi:predicted ester cyclase